MKNPGSSSEENQIQNSFFVFHSNQKTNSNFLFLFWCLMKLENLIQFSFFVFQVIVYKQTLKCNTTIVFTLNKTIGGSKRKIKVLYKEITNQEKIKLLYYEGYCIKEFLSNWNNTVRDLLYFLKEHYPDVGEFSARTIERFCRQKAWHKRWIIHNA